MFDKILEVLLGIWHEIIPFVIVDQYEKGILLRFGKFVRCVEPGLHIKWPYADKIMTEHVAWTTINLPPQSLVTKDDKNIVISAVIKYRVNDIKTFLLEVWDTVDAISDMTQGIIKKAVMSKTWEELRNEEVDNELAKKSRIEAKRWGIEIGAVTLANLAQIRSIRLFNDSTSAT
jgi:regulator of protease activity HflC (stomatin/prohibitin superfamily)